MHRSKARVLKLPAGIERDKAKIIGRKMPLQRSGEGSASNVEGSGPCIQQLPRGPGCYVTIDFILDACAISELAIDRKDGNTVSFRNRRTVIGKSRGPQPLLSDSILLPNRDLIRV
jgi:hypothetical protein